MAWNLRRVALAGMLAVSMAPALAHACGATAAPRDQDFAWMSMTQWQQRHADHSAIADKGEVDLLFVGDSITQGWDHAVWERSFAQYRPANFGIGGDHTGNVLWRLRNGRAGKLHPKAVVLLIGVNNVGFCNDTPEQAYAGVQAVVAQLRTLYPQARILLNGVFPYGQLANAPQRAPVAQLNRMIAKMDDGKHVFFRDYGALFLQADGSISPEIMGDFLHLTPKGYQIWADAMLPDIKNVLAEVIKADDARVTVMGRTDAAGDGSLRFAYPGVSLHLAFEGKRLTMDAAGAREHNYLDVMVDGGAPRTLRLAPEMKTITLVDQASAAKHTVEIVNRSETWHGVATVKQFATDGTWQTPAALPARKLLVLGDSVSCGEAIDRVPGAKKEAAWWNPRASYGMLLARQLNAQVQLVCYGGRGLVRTWEGKTDQLNLADYYGMAIADGAHPVKWDQRRYQADVILSAIGTNDFNPGIPEREQFVQAYVKLVKTLLSDHPKARIALTEGAIQNGERRAALVAYIGETVRRVNDPRVQAVASTHYPGDAIDAHPTRAQHAAMAAGLAPQLRQMLK